MALSEQAKKKLARRQSKQKEETALLRGVLDSPNGKEFLKRISEMCKENEATYVDHNPNGTAYHEGQRSIVLGIRKILNRTFNQPVQEKAVL